VDFSEVVFLAVAFLKEVCLEEVCLEVFQGALVAQATSK
jgi:hypothetical protein